MPNETVDNSTMGNNSANTVRMIVSLVPTITTPTIVNHCVKLRNLMGLTLRDGNKNAIWLDNLEFGKVFAGGCP